MDDVQHRWASGLARISRAAAACLIALALAFSVVAPTSSAFASHTQSDVLPALSSPSAPGETGSDEPADWGTLLHVHCGCHQVMRAESVTFEPARMADRITYPVTVEPLTSRAASPLRRPPQA